MQDFNPSLSLTIEKHEKRLRGVDYMAQKMGPSDEG